MTSSEIRQSFLDFFHSKDHTIVPSAGLLPDSPNLLFTNAGMNQFVPIFLGESPADVARWANVTPASNTRAADTQKCIRAGGKHNDLDDVGIDTYHHTFFEMLGNWSFGDYFKQEAITWAWELITEHWKFPKERLYATIYAPGEGEPSTFDEEAYAIWEKIFSTCGLDPAKHIVRGGKKDNFWMMGETGPCGPCSEIHIDLTPEGTTQGSLVNQDSQACIELWNLVFIQFNANPDGSFSPLPSRHVDTGMGLERVASVMQCTKGFTDFQHAKISNYATDLFTPIFEALQNLCGHSYQGTLPGDTVAAETIAVDIAFRVIADHLRTLSFAIADGIQPGNNDRHYVLRRILRRAIRYGRILGLKDPFFHKLVPVLSQIMGKAFPEIPLKQSHIAEVLHREEIMFNRTLDRGIDLFEKETHTLQPGATLSGEFAFRLYDEQGFPLDLTELMAGERGLKVDHHGFDLLMDAQRKRARKAQKRQIIEVSEIPATEPTRFTGFEQEATACKVLDVVSLKDHTVLITDASVCYAEMGGQVGDRGEFVSGAQSWVITHTRKSGNTHLHFLSSSEGETLPEPGMVGELHLDKRFRKATERHHTATHLLHWALHEVVSREAAQKGSFVGPDKLTFDFNSAALTPAQLQDIERLINERILENAPVSWTEVAYDSVRGRKDIQQFFGDKYGAEVRVVQIGGQAGNLDGYSMELCGGTHVSSTGELGLLHLVSESAIAAGVRRIEAVAGLPAWQTLQEERRTHIDRIAELESKLHHTEKILAKERQQALHAKAEALVKTWLSASSHGSPQLLAKHVQEASGETLQEILHILKARHFEGVAALASTYGEQVLLATYTSPDWTKTFPAGDILKGMAPYVDGKGGGKPDMARGAGRNASGINEALQAVKERVRFT